MVWSVKPNAPTSTGKVSPRVATSMKKAREQVNGTKSLSTPSYI